MKKFEHGGNVYGVRLDFSVNINPLGISEKVKNAVINIADSFGVYPDAEYRELRRKIAQKESVSIENIVCSNGAAEMIFAAVRAVNPKRALIISPTFSEYERALLSIGCEIEYYDLREENNFCLQNDFPGRLDGIDMVFICNPNNPTGNICDREILDKISAKKDTVCVIDECFMDLADGYSMNGKMPVIKAFTKTYAMAGLRLGYMICDSYLAEKIKAQLPMWNVSQAAQAAGIAALDENLEMAAGLIKTEREYLSEELRKLSFKVFDSETNFILIKGQEGIYEKLLERGILIRSCDNFRGLDGRFYRIAVKTHEENEELIKGLGDICG